MTEDESNIIAGNRLWEYLRERLQKAVLSRDLQLAETTEFYLVNLLKTFERSEHLYKVEDGRCEEEPLAMMLSHAISGDTATQMRELKRLGDTALYFSGMFAEHIKKGPVTINYYVDMGSSAYASLAAQMVGEKLFEELYAELSEKFLDLSSVFSELAVADSVTSNIGLLNLYERWLKTGNEEIRKRLVKEGIAPQDKKISC